MNLLNIPSVLVRKVVYKVEQNKKYGDFRVVKYINGIWENEFDGNWTKGQANRKCKLFRSLLILGQEK